jgi:integrase
LSGAGRDLALFNLAIDSKLRGCDLVRLHVNDDALTARYETAPASFSERPAGPSSLRSPNKPERQSAIGSPMAHS